MFNKIYNVVKKSIRENFVSICLYIIVLFIILYPVDYYIITGGGSFDAKNRVEIKNAQQSKGSFNMAYVSEMKGTIFTYLLSYIVPSYERESIEDYQTNDKESIEDIEFRNTLWLNETNNSSIYVAYTKAKKEIKIKSAKNYIFYLDEKSKTNLKIGDEILSVEDTKIDGIETLKKKIAEYKEGDKLKIKVKRKKKELERYAYIYTEENTNYIGISLLEDVIYETNPEVKFHFKKSESGPSGGLIMTLQIYIMLTKEDITHGKKIVGTGTITKEGEVGEIDGVKYKLKGAVKNKADIFLVANGRNYKEATKEKEKNNYKIKIIGVDTFDEAVEKLNNIK